MMDLMMVCLRGCFCLMTGIKRGIKMGPNFIKLDVFSLRYNHYAFIDTEDYLADRLFINHKVTVDFGREYKCEGKPYIVIFCKVKKKDDEAFRDALSEMENKMLLMGYKDYSEVCNMVSGNVA